MPDLNWNLKVWDKAYTWPSDGDEWTQQAEFCGVPYDKWKRSLVLTYMIPNLVPTSNVLEIGPGHGRWSVMIAPRVPKGSLTLVDMSASCVDFCKKRIPETNVKYIVNDGRSLNGIAVNSIDFVWSFDTFVHIEEPEVRSYAKDLSIVMKRNAMGVIHHSGSPTQDQRNNGMRSMVTSKKFSMILAEVGLHTVRQSDSWGDGCNFKLTGDVMTVFVKP